jgi:ABC-type nitrate/sulfonate/bicarbonate transport system ATPase subunit
LLYFTSGFLTIQFEIQNFFSFCQLGGIPIMAKKAESRYNREHVNNSTVNAEEVSSEHASSFSYLNDNVASAILKSTSLEHLFENLVNISTMNVPQPSISVPLYDRAYPSRGYAKDLFWHNLGTILSVALIIYFSVPAAMAAKEFCNDALKGQFDSLQTLPGVTMHVLCTTSVAACWLTSLFPFVLVYVMFVIMLQFTSPIIPSLALLLMSFSLGSMGVVISSWTKNVETAVVMVPTAVFLMAIPGMVYYDLAFDVQRTALVEIMLCLLPPSAAIIILRSVCTMESLSLPLLLSTTSLVSNVPVLVHLIVLVFDGLFYFSVAILWSSYQFQLRAKQLASAEDIRRHNVEPVESFASGGFAILEYVTTAWQTMMSKDIILTSQEYELVGMNGTHYDSIEQHRYESSSNSDIKDLGNVGLVVSDVSKSYVSTEKECQIQVLSHIQATLHAGQVTTLLGSNGGGKTTLLRILGGFDYSYEGDIFYVKEAEDERRVVGWCSQNDALYHFLTIREHLEMYCEILSLAGNQLTSLTDEPRSVSKGITSLLNSLDLLEHQFKYPTSLSGGMKRRLSLAMAALGDPMILLLDEPTSGCDR